MNERLGRSAAGGRTRAAATGATRAARIGKVAVSAGFFVLFLGILVAYRAQSTGYEVSVYAGTPSAYWAGLAVAMAVSVGVAAGTAGWTRRAALVLGGTGVVSMVSLPLIRGYYFYGEPDSMTHLGWIRELDAGLRSPFEMFYPGIHMVTVFIHDVTGVPLPQASNVMVVAFVAVFLVFLTLAVRTIATGEMAVVIGAVSAFMLLPINNINIMVLPHPISQSVLLSAFLFYLLFRYLSGTDAHASLGPITSLGVVFGIASIAVVFFHPMQALVMILIFGAVMGAQFLHRRYDPRSFVTAHRPLYVQTGILVAMFLLWTPRFGGFYHQIELVLGAVGEFFFGEGRRVGGVVADRQEALVGMGIGLEEVFVKLFLVSAVYAAFAGVLMLASLSGQLDERNDLGAAAGRYLAYGMMVLFPVAALHLIGDISKLFFRYFGTMIVIATLLGAVALYRLGRDQYSSGATRALLGVALVTMLALSLVTVFPAPYTHQPSMHVSEPQHDGYATAFEYQDDEVEMVGVGWQVWRYRHMTLGPRDQEWSGEAIPAEPMRRDVTGHYGEERYIVYSEFDRQRELDVYLGLRYSQADFDGLRTQNDVHNVQSNGEVWVYKTE